MKNDAIVSNIFNRNSVIIKNNKTSYIVNNVKEDIKLSSLTKKVDAKSADNISSQSINTSEINLISTNKEEKDILLYIPYDTIFGGEKFRYVRDWLNGSNQNSGCHWVELQVIHNDGTNLAYGKSVISNGSLSNSSYITDGSTNTNNYAGISNGGDCYIEIDLGREYYISEVKEIIVWHYYSDGRTYYNTKTEISKDKSEWKILRDSSVDGVYQETAQGMLMKLTDIVKQNIYPSFANSNIGEVITGEHCTTGKILVNDNKALVKAIDKNSAIEKNLRAIKFKSIHIDENFKSDNVYITAKDKKSNNYNVLNNFRYASTVVSTKIPVDTGGSNGTGGEGLKSLDLELIPLNYVKIKLGFADKKVVDSIGLPPGLKITEGYIEGSPVISGDYNIKILLDDNTFIPGKIKVHVLDRIL